MARADEILNERKRVDYQSLEPDGVRTALAAVQLRCYLRAHRDHAADLPYGQWIACSVWSACQCVVCLPVCGLLASVRFACQCVVCLSIYGLLVCVCRRDDDRGSGGV